MSTGNWAYSDAEIAVMFRQAKDQRGQIGIIADLCNRTKEQVEERLVALGCTLPTEKKVYGQRLKPRRRRPKQQRKGDQKCRQNTF